MRLAAHVVRMLWEAFRYALATRRVSVVLVILVGLVLLAVALGAQATAPLLLYPFA